MTDVSTTKSIIALTVVVGCFAVLWPKIFYPMMQVAFRVLFSGIQDEGQTEGKQNGKPEEVHRRPGRPPMPRHPGQAYTQPQSSQGGVMGLIMPVYTIGVILFFFYTLFKVMSKKPDKTPKIKNVHVDPENRKFVYSEECDGVTNLKKESKMKGSAIPEANEEEEEREDVDTKDNELMKLRIRLAETEAAMTRILKQMGDASQKLSSTIPSHAKEPKKEETGSIKVASYEQGLRKRMKNKCMEDEKKSNFKSVGDCSSKDILTTKESEDAKNFKLTDSIKSEVCEIIEDDRPLASESDESDQISDIIKCVPDLDLLVAAQDSNSSFEYISSCENTPISPDKAINGDTNFQDSKQNCQTFDLIEEE